MRWSAFDYTVPTDGRAASGTPAAAVEHAEVWTFVRSRGGHWLLSAIQQTT